MEIKKHTVPIAVLYSICCDFFVLPVSDYRFFWKKYMYTIGKIPAEFTINKAINHGS
jgi:hypothetical protein